MRQRVRRDNPGRRRHLRQHRTAAALITLEAGLGFALFSIAITYVLSVYGALLRATALAVQARTFVGHPAGEDAVDLLCRTIGTGGESDLLAWLRQTISGLAGTAQAQAQYPLIAYFRVVRDHRPRPLPLGDLLELLTTCRALLVPSAAPALSGGHVSVAAW